MYELLAFYFKAFLFLQMLSKFQMFDDAVHWYCGSYIWSSFVFSRADSSISDIQMGQRQTKTHLRCNIMIAELQKLAE